MLAWLMGLKTVSPKELLDLTRSGAVLVVDVNAPQRFAKQHVPHALNLDHEHFTAPALPDDRDAMLVFYCTNSMCRKAPIAARRAERMGYKKVRVMSAGISGWIAAGMPIEQARV
jgi:rhodanese-related sulfurtransferase